MQIVALFSRSVWFDAPNKVSIRDEEICEIDEKVIVKSLFSGISLGTESLVLNGKVPQEITRQMKLKYQQGDFSFPIKYGYSLVGKVISEGKYTGEIVHILHPHQTHAVVEKHDIFLINRSIPLPRVALISNMETAVNAIWDAKPLLGDKIAVVGFGLIGSLIARILKEIQGYEVWIDDISPVKQKLAGQMGFNLIGDHDGSFDIVFHSSGDYRGLQKSIKLAGKEAKIIELSWYGAKRGNIELGTEFHYRRHKIISSQVSTVAYHRKDIEERKQICLDLLKNDCFDDHITKIVPFNEVKQVYKHIDAIRKTDLGVVIQY
ncbi:MAG: dehydrogenase [Methanobacteriota archaeon]|nr:MAG: dehydrogenase [Euryarchaeota archaeon]